MEWYRDTTGRFGIPFRIPTKRTFFTCIIPPKSKMAEKRQKTGLSDGAFLLLAQAPAHLNCPDFVIYICCTKTSKQCRCINRVFCTSIWAETSIACWLCHTIGLALPCVHTGRGRLPRKSFHSIFYKSRTPQCNMLALPHKWHETMLAVPHSTFFASFHKSRIPSCHVLALPHCTNAHAHTPREAASFTSKMTPSTIKFFQRNVQLGSESNFPGAF